MDSRWDVSPALPIPLDVLLDVLLLLPLSAVLALRRTCKTFHAITHLRALWVLLFRTHVLDQHIPFPDLGVADLTSLSTCDLESLTRRALALRRTWSSPNPVPRRQLTFATPAEPGTRVIFLQFLPGRSNRWLISVRMAARPRSYLLQCWDVATPHPRCVAELRHADGPYGGIVLNSDPSSPAVLAMQSAQTETFSIRFDAQDPECAFETEAIIDGIRELHLLCGSTLVTRRRDQAGALSLWDLADLSSEKVLLLNPSILHPDDQVQAVHIAHDYAIVVRIQSVEIYSTIPRPNIVPLRGAPIAYPLAQFRFQWRTDTVVLCEQHASHFQSPSCLCSPSDYLRTTPSNPPHRPHPIHLFVRFASIYPWPVNVLHHFVLRPNPAYLRPARPYTRRATPKTTTEYNLPYDIRPWPMHTIGSPVRLFGQSSVALGRYGTALWLDHHTEEWLGPSERGQRLAGRLVLDFDDEGGEGTTNVTTISPEPAESSSGGGGGGQCATMVFAVRNDDDAWTRIALEEEAGRIALGHVDGAITLLEYS